MKLDRNVSGIGRGKYGIVKTRKLTDFDGNGSFDMEVQAAVKTLERAGVLSWGDTTDSEFFVVMLKDQNAHAALHAYAESARHAKQADRELATDVQALAVRSGPYHPNCKAPD